MDSMEKEIKSLGEKVEKIFDAFKPMFIDGGLWDDLDNSFIKWGWVKIYKRLKKEEGISGIINYNQKVKFTQKQLEKALSHLETLVNKEGFDIEKCRKNKKNYSVNDLIKYFDFLFSLPFHKENAYFILDKLKEGIEKECFEIQKYLIKFQFPSKRYFEILGKIKNKLDNEIEVEKYLKSEEKERLENFKEKVIGITKEKIGNYIETKLENFVKEGFKNILIVDREIKFDNLFYGLLEYIRPFFENSKEEKDWENKYEELKKELKRNSEKYEWNQFKKYLRNLPEKIYKIFNKGSKKIKEIIDKKMDIYN